MAEAHPSVTVPPEVVAEVAQLMATYCHGVDHHEWDLVRRCFTDDAMVAYGQYNGDPDGFVQYAAGGLAGMIRHSHQLGQTYIRLRGDGLRSETYATCFHRYQADAGREDLVVGARYIDDLTRDPAGVWKIHRRTMAYDWTRIDAVQKELEDPSVILGSADLTDPWYTEGAGPT